MFICVYLCSSVVKILTVIFISQVEFDDILKYFVANRFFILAPLNQGRNLDDEVDQDADANDNAR